MKISKTETNTRLGFRFTIMQLIAMNRACRMAKLRIEGEPSTAQESEPDTPLPFPAPVRLNSETEWADQTGIVKGVDDAASLVGLTQQVITQAVSRGSLQCAILKMPFRGRPGYVFRVADLKRFADDYRAKKSTRKEVVS
jgi:hypothetical protein